MAIDFSSMDFKEALEWILEDCDLQEIYELVECVEVDDILIHEDSWEKFTGMPKPENDIELCGEHFFKDWQ